MCVYVLPACWLRATSCICVLLVRATRALARTVRDSCECALAPHLPVVVLEQCKHVRVCTTRVLVARYELHMRATCARDARPRSNSARLLRVCASPTPTCCRTRTMQACACMYYPRAGCALRVAYACYLCARRAPSLEQCATPAS